MYSVGQVLTFKDGQTVTVLTVLDTSKTNTYMYEVQSTTGARFIAEQHELT